MPFRARNRGPFRAGTGFPFSSATLNLPATILSLSPVGYWKLDDTSGAAVDYGTIGNNGTYTNGPVLAGTAGPDGSSYPTFDGTNDHVLVLDADGYSINQSGTGLSWLVIFKVTSVSTQRMVFYKGNTSNPFNCEWDLVFNPSTGVLTHETYTNAGALIRSGSITVSTGTQWRVVIVTKSTPAASPTFYYNGTIPSVTAGGTGSGTYTNNNGSVYWSGPSFNGAFMAGSVAHATIFPTELTAPQATSIMTAADAEGWF